MLTMPLNGGGGSNNGGDFPPNVKGCGVTHLPKTNKHYRNTKKKGRWEEVTSVGGL